MSRFPKALTVLLGVALSTLLIAFLSPLRQSVEAQNTGTVQLATRVQTFSYNSTYAGQVINIGSVSQVGHMINFFWPVQELNPVTLCHLSFEGSVTGNSPWYSMASGVATKTVTFVNSQVIYANGYWPYLRVVINPEGFTPCETGTFSLIYSGFATAVPINNLTNTIDVTGDLGGATAVAPPGITNVPTGPFILAGLQCSNSGGSAAFVQYFSQSAAPTLGTSSPLMTALIPAGGNWAYSGPQIAQTIHDQYFWLAATTTRTGSTPASNVSCIMQINYNGPFYPLSDIH